MSNVTFNVSFTNEYGKYTTQIFESFETASNFYNHLQVISKSLSINNGMRETGLVYVDKDSAFIRPRLLETLVEYGVIQFPVREQCNATRTHTNGITGETKTHCCEELGKHTLHICSYPHCSFCWED